VERGLGAAELRKPASRIVHLDRRGLGRLVDDGAVDEATAARWARLVLAGNASRLYRL
jgi:hypothetical protein